MEKDKYKTKKILRIIKVSQVKVKPSEFTFYGLKLTLEDGSCFTERFESYSNMKKFLKNYKKEIKDYKE